MPPRNRQRPSGSSNNTALTPTRDTLHVGSGPQPAAPTPPAPVKTRVPFGSYLAPDLQRQYKARCVLLGIEMQDALEDAITDWLDKNPA